MLIAINGQELLSARARTDGVNGQSAAAGEGEDRRSGDGGGGESEGSSVVGVAGDDGGEGEDG